MSDPIQHDALLQRAIELCSQINALSAWTAAQDRSQERLVVSFDVYCILLEYTVYMQQTGGATQTLDDYLQFDDLMYEADGRPLDVVIDFFLPSNTIRIE